MGFVHVGIYGGHFVSHEEVLDQELVAGLFGGVALEVALIAGITDIHGWVPPLMNVYGNGVC
jgi:hypothetical protein